MESEPYFTERLIVFETLGFNVETIIASILASSNEVTESSVLADVMVITEEALVTSLTFVIVSVIGYSL